jgi:hypothetical protein
MLWILRSFCQAEQAAVTARIPDLVSFFLAEEARKIRLTTRPSPSRSHPRQIPITLQKQPEHRRRSLSQ